MRRYLAYILFLSIFVICSGCVTLPHPEQMSLEVRDFELPMSVEAGSALVYVVRPEYFGGGVRFEVFLDGQDADSEMGYTRGSQHIYFFVSPGNHQIWSYAENWTAITVEVKEGDIIFLKQTPQVGLIMARNNFTLLDTIEGKYHVKNTSIGTIIKTHK